MNLKSKHSENTRMPYQLKSGNLTVEIIYSKNNKTFNECILNILKQKNKMG